VTAIHTKLFPAEYLLRLAPKENLKERLEIEVRAQNFKESLYAEGGAMVLLSTETRAAVE
jgi:hypothetical protein